MSGREILFSKPFLLPLQAVFERLEKVSMKALVGMSYIFSRILFYLTMNVNELISLSRLRGVY